MFQCVVRGHIAELHHAGFRKGLASFRQIQVIVPAVHISLGFHQARCPTALERIEVEEPLDIRIQQLECCTECACRHGQVLCLHELASVTFQGAWIFDLRLWVPMLDLCNARAHYCIPAVDELNVIECFAIIAVLDDGIVVTAWGLLVKCFGVESHITIPDVQRQSFVAVTNASLSDL